MKVKQRAEKKMLWFMMVMAIVFTFCIGAGMVSAAGKDQMSVAIDHAVFQDTKGAALPQAPSVRMYSMRRTSGWSYGSQLTLSENEMAMYQALAEVENLKEYYFKSNDDYRGIVLELPNPYVCAGTLDTYQFSEGYKQGQREWNRATHAFLRDYGMEYWISYFAVGYSRSVTEQGQVIIKSLEFIPVDYYDEIRSELGMTENELNAAIRMVGNIEGSYERVKAAHDYVVELVTYNYENMAAPYGHTITGGLLDKYNHRGVCECYSKLFRLLCVENGIPCILVTGGDKKDNSGNVVADHMWNNVQMDDGNWYLVDTTWDDQESGIRYEYFLAGSNSEGFRDIVADDHMPVGCFSNDVFYEPFAVPTLAVESYSVNHKVPVTDILLKETEIEMEVDSIATVAVEGYLPENATSGKNVIYTSADNMIATVDSRGRIVAYKPGKVTITVTSTENSSVKATCEVTVFDHKWVGAVTEEPTCTTGGIITYTCENKGCTKTKQESTMYLGHKAGALVTVTEASCTKDGRQEQRCERCDDLLKEITIKSPGTHTWDSWKKKTAATCTKAEVQSRKCRVVGCGEIETKSVGKPNGHKAGQWVVTQPATNKTEGKQIQKCTVCKSALKTQSIAKTFVKLNVDGSVPLQVKKSTTAIKIASQTKGDTVVKWSSDNEKVLKVNAKTGKLTAQKKTGKATVTVTMRSGATDSVVVKVQKGKVTTSKLTVSKKSVTLKVKQSATVTATKAPITTADKVKFTTSNKKVATVTSSGKITGKKAGKAKITAKCGKKKVTINVVVTK